jgi:hypothetical protein
MMGCLATVIDLVLCPRGVNAAFVVLCLFSAFGLPHRWTMLASAGLYLGLVLTG